MGDVVARYKRARGFNVLHPMGWDAFGMPAENAAMEQGVHPGAWTYENIAAMRAQLRSMGLSIDWSREIATCHPGYYRHQQAMFLDFLESGLLVPRQRLGQLGPGRPHGARQRAGDRRPRLALRRPGREARDAAMVPPHHRLRRGPARRARRAGALARQGADDAGELDRPLGRAPPHLPDGRARAAGSTSTPRGTTRSSGRASARSRPSIRSPPRSRGTTRRSPPSSRNAAAPAPARRRSSRPRSGASIPGSGSATRSARNGRCRSMSPTSS